MGYANCAPGEHALFLCTWNFSLEHQTTHRSITWKFTRLWGFVWVTLAFSVRELLQGYHEGLYCKDSPPCGQDVQTPDHLWTLFVQVLACIHDKYNVTVYRKATFWESIELWMLKHFYLTIFVVYLPHSGLWCVVTSLSFVFVFITVSLVPYSTLNPFKFPVAFSLPA